MLFKSIDSANVGMALDVWHWHLGGGTLDQIRSLGDKIMTLSLADADPGMTGHTADETSRRLPGATGVIDSAAVLAALGEARFDGPVTVMPSKTIFPGLGREKIVKQTAAALDAVWKAAGLGQHRRRQPPVSKRNGKPWKTARPKKPAPEPFPFGGPGKSRRDSWTFRRFVPLRPRIETDAGRPGD